MSNVSKGYCKSFSGAEESNSHFQHASFNNKLSFLRRKHVNKLIISHSSINSLMNKLEFLVQLVRGNVGITAWKVSKYIDFTGPYLDTFDAVYFIEIWKELDESFPIGQFKIEGF